MLFDLTGKRKHVVRVVYAILALLMGASLFLVIGPFNIAELVDSGSSTNATAALDDRAERIEEQLLKDPEDEALLLSLSRSRMIAGNALIEADPETGATVVTPEARSRFESGLRAWNQYLKVTEDEPNPTVAQMAGRAYFSLAETSGTIGEIEENIEKASAAQRLAAKSQPSVNSLSTLAIYEYFAGNFAAGDKAVKQAAKTAPSKSTGKDIETQMEAYRKRGKQWEKQKKQLAKEQKKRGREELQGGSFSGFGSTTLAP